MAFRDAVGLLNGLRRVGGALWSETSSELQHAVSNSSLRSVASSLNEVVELAAARMEWVGKQGQRLGPSGLGEDFSDWEEHFPSMSSFQGGFTPGDDGVSSEAMGQGDQTRTSKWSPPPSSFPPGPPPSFPPGREGSRQYHTYAVPLPPWKHKRGFHTSSWYGNETVVGSSAARQVDMSKSEKKQKLNPRAREKAVPASRISRMVSFGGLAAGLGVGTATEMAKRTLGMSDSASLIGDNPFLTEANIERIVNTLCRVRGAALKIGQMISLQDSTLVPEPIQQMFDRVRNNADFMPLWQMEKVLKEELGEDWREKVKDFDPKPLAAASIGQVHSAVLHDGQHVAVKIQYPGVAESINSDIDNLMGILKLWSILPEGLFMDAMVAVARKELAWETDYIREAQCQMKFKELLADDPGFLVPTVIPELSTKGVLTTQLIHGLPLDQCASLTQEVKNDIAARVLTLVLRELFEFQFMQTDPNWSNFFYNAEDNRICLLDFGASREYPKMFTNHYLKVIHGSVTEDREEVLHNSKAMGFLTGYESKTLLDAHYKASLILGEPFKHDQLFDFGKQDTTTKIHQLIPILLDHRLTPPPEDSYSLHRKLSGAFLLCAKLEAVFNCHAIFHRIYSQYEF